jgi:Transcriptional regulator
LNDIKEKDINKKEDMRIRRTHKLLSNALIKLLKEKPFEKISVIDICDEAMVHRATFYTHFEDKYQLLAYSLKELEMVFDKEDITENSFEGYKKYYKNVVTEIVNEVIKNKDLFSIFLKKNKKDSIVSKLQDTAIIKVKEKVDKLVQSGICPAIPSEILSCFYVGACISVISWWVENNMPIPSETLIKYIDNLFQKVDDL